MSTESAAGAAPPALPRSGILELRSISVRFGGITALDDVSFNVAAGEVLGLIGPNGAGKTTLFDVVSGVRSPNEGSVILAGEDVTHMPAVERARRGMRRTFQRVQTFGWLSVEDNVLAALEWRGGGGGFLADAVQWPFRRRREVQRRSLAVEALDLCGLVTLKDDPVASLPIGVARMVELARAIVDSPSLLLLDEPASGLDEAEADRLASVIRSVRDEIGSAVLLVEHDAGFVMEQCERVIVLDQGAVLAHGSPEEIQLNERVRVAYLGQVD